MSYEKKEIGDKIIAEIKRMKEAEYNYTEHQAQIKALLWVLELMNINY